VQEDFGTASLSGISTIGDIPVRRTLRYPGAEMAGWAYYVNGNKDALESSL
jgi:hypothetical protein